MRVIGLVSETLLKDHHGRPVPSTLVDCARCGNSACVFGRGDRSISRALQRLRETCPRSEDNFYIGKAVTPAT